MLPTIQFACKYGLGTCDALLCVSYTVQSELENEQQARSVHAFDFSAAFDKVNHPRMDFKICSVVQSVIDRFSLNGQVRCSRSL